jgi:hypothetical protein
VSPTAILTPEIPSEAEAVLAKETKDILAPRVGKSSSLDLRAMNFASEPTIKIPASAARLLVQILDEMSRCNDLYPNEVIASCGDASSESSQSTEDSRGISEYPREARTD